jgi:hypothetical protein
MTVEEDRNACIVGFTSHSLLLCVCPLVLPRSMYSISVHPHNIVRWSSSRMYISDIRAPHKIVPWSSSPMYISDIRAPAQYCAVEFLTDVHIRYPCARTILCGEVPDGCTYPISVRAVKFLTDVHMQWSSSRMSPIKASSQRWMICDWVIGYWYKKTL